MRPLPRKLELLIIDDELMISYEGYHVPESLDVLHVDKDRPGINEWRTALQFWTSFQYGEVPDLVLADVRFIEDRTSPLSSLFKPKENYLPTGLSHLKPFAALSRALGKPIGVCARTIDPELWQEQMMSSSPEHKAMGYLGMHEIGELAAILGDGKAILGETNDLRQHINNCYLWLQKNSATEFEQGVRNAVQAYRRSLFGLLTMPSTPSVFVRPDHYAELMGWCERMRKDPQPLNSEHDFGLELTYHNGRRDFISLASLFADYDRITDKALDPSSFASDGLRISEPWKLDDDGRPRIGAYLQQLGSLTEACNAAAEALETRYKYPSVEDVQPMSLAEAKRRYGYSDLTAGLMVLFQFVCIEQARVENWEHNFKNCEWNPRELKFTGSQSARRSLAGHLNSLIELIREYYHEFELEAFTREALFDFSSEKWVELDTEENEEDSDWVKWHFEKLVDLKVLDVKVKDGEDSYTLTHAWRESGLLTTPPPASHVVPRESLAQLRKSFGYRNTDYHSLGRVVADAFGGPEVRNNDNERSKIGRAILKDFETPSLPFFLLDLCRYYARNLRNWPKETWPVWMRLPEEPA